MHLDEKLHTLGQKKILALDGGGIRGLITIEILAKIEQELRDREKKPSLVLSDYFDFVAGTSTGALIGAAISMGMSVDEIREFYVDSGKEMFDYAGIWNEYKNGYKYHKVKLEKILKKVFGAETLLGSEDIKTLLLIVMHNTQTDSPWPVSNNPNAKYNDLSKDKKYNNLQIPLWQLLRASTAAPTFFPAEEINIDDIEHIFADGGITPYNNPAFQAYLMSTLVAYNLNWEKGEDKMLLVSVGTGETSLAEPFLKYELISKVEHAKRVPNHIINSVSYQQDMLCRIFGKCLVGHKLDGEIGDLKDENGLGCTSENLFTYLRYDVKLNKETLNELGLSHIDHESIGQLDAVENIKSLKEIGKKVGEKEVKIEDFEGF